MKLDYLYGSRGEDFRFYQLPALLLEAEEYKGLSAQAKILYSILLSKVSLSRKNGWIEEDTDRIYIICHQEEMMRLLGCSRPTAGKALHELNDIGLLEKKRRGLGRPDIIYVKDFSSVSCSEDKVLENENVPEESNFMPEEHLNGKEMEDTRKPGKSASENKGLLLQKRDESDTQKSNPFTSRCKKSLHQEVKDFYIRKSNNFTSRSQESLHLDVKDFDTSYIDNSYINRDISYQSIYPAIIPEDLPEDLVTAETDRDSDKGDFYAVREMVRSQIDYPVLIHDQQMDKLLIDSLVELIAEVLLSEKESARIAGEYIPLFRVKERFRRLSMAHIQYVLLCMRNTSTAVGNIYAYLLTALYQAPETMAFYYQQRVNHDLLDTS